MLRRVLQSCAVAALLAGCGGNPFVEPEPENTALPEELPGTAKPGESTSITRYEAKDDGGDESPYFGNGFAEDFTYDKATDTYVVDNLGFDGANGYKRGTKVKKMGGYNVYEASSTEIDPQTGVAIPQFLHRMVAAHSKTGRTEFAIVRTGAYADYGFGGFVIKRNDGVTLPSTGQAGYSGKYAGLRDYDGKAGLNYVSGDMTVAIDFEDFNDGDAVQGHVTNRQIFDMTGKNVTAAFLAGLDKRYDPDDKVAPSTELPTLNFKVGPGVIDTNGEIRGYLNSYVTDYRGETPNNVVFEDGKYYAIVSGEKADEVVGVIVVESPDPVNETGTVRETGGFILYRP